VCRCLLSLPGPATPAWSPCDLVFDLDGSEKPEGVELRAEFRSPHHRTYLMRAFRDGDRRFVIRFSPTEAGSWDYRVTSSLPRLDGKARPIQCHRIRFAGLCARRQRASFSDGQRAAAPVDGDWRREISCDSAVGVRYLSRGAGEREILALTRDDRGQCGPERGGGAHSRGQQTGHDSGHHVCRDPRTTGRCASSTSRMSSRGSPRSTNLGGISAVRKHPAWARDSEGYGRAAQETRSVSASATTMAEVTSAALAGDGWMDVLGYGTTDANIGGVEHQFFQSPALAAGIKNTHDLWERDHERPVSGRWFPAK